MKPIGLTFKKDGELMIVHSCLNCGKISPNRIAGEDNPHVVISLLDVSDKVTSSNIKLLTMEDRQMILTILYGYGYQEKL
jgi:hypothetical protein